jgi:hypothetical protein
MAEGGAEPIEVPPSSPRKSWTRRGLAEMLKEDVSTLVGIAIEPRKGHELKPPGSTRSIPCFRGQGICR